MPRKPIRGRPSCEHEEEEEDKNKPKIDCAYQMFTSQLSSHSHLLRAVDTVAALSSHRVQRHVLLKSCRMMGGAVATAYSMRILLFTDEVWENCGAIAAQWILSSFRDWFFVCCNLDDLPRWRLSFGVLITRLTVTSARLLTGK
jgi:hypothetical protein